MSCIDILSYLYPSEPHNVMRGGSKSKALDAHNPSIEPLLGSFHDAS